MDENRPHKVGYKQPPLHTRWAKDGPSPNKRGRPKTIKIVLPHDLVLNRMVTVVEGGVSEQRTAEEAFILRILAHGHRNPRLAKLAYRLSEKIHARSRRPKQKLIAYVLYTGPGEIRRPMRKLGMAVLQDPYGPNAKYEIDGALVTEALARLGDRRLSEAEQRTVMRATMRPQKVVWPDWWTVTVDDV